MELNLPRPIRLSGWAFELSSPICKVFSPLNVWFGVLCLTLIVMAQVGGVQPVIAQQDTGGQDRARDADSGHEHHGASLVSGWEGSVQGIAYSESNHHVAGLLILLIGISEMSHTLRFSSLSWARLLLPGALGAAGIFLLIWSDHEAWPIGPLSFTETFFGQDQEIVQHKLFGTLALIVSAIEILRRSARVTHVAWAAPLPLFALIGGMMLFAHSHGAHPAAQKIAMHHAVMGTMAITAGSSKLAAMWMTGSSSGAPSRWELVWAGLILLIGAQLLIYSE